MGGRRLLYPLLVVAALGTAIVLARPRSPGGPVAAAPLEAPEPPWLPREFTHEVPGVIVVRHFPYLRAVEVAARRRWFDDEEAYRLAEQAWEKTRRHAQLVDPETGNPAFRATEVALAVVHSQVALSDYEVEVTFARPYLLCFVSRQRMADEDFIELPRAERRGKRAALEAGRSRRRRIVTEVGTILQQTYAEFMSRYATPCGLVDLMAPFGGRPDLPVGRSSYLDGALLTVLILDDDVTFDMPAFMGATFSPRGGWVAIRPGGADRDFEVNQVVHEATHQLVYWFSKQKQGWGRVSGPQTFFVEGFAVCVGSVSMAEDRTLTFHGLNRPRLEFLGRVREVLRKEGKPFHLFPLRDLVGFEGHDAVRAWANARWGVDGLFMFHAQSWALIRFLHEGTTLRASFEKFLAAMLSAPSDEAAKGYAAARFAEALGLRSEEDWRRLDGEFSAWLARLLDAPPAAAAPPPALADWPGYVPHEPVDPRSW